MIDTQKIAILAKIIETQPTQAEFAGSLLAALAKGKATPKQMAWIDRLCNPVRAANLSGILAAFREKAKTAKFPKVAVTVGGTEWVLAYVSPASEKAKPENRDTVGISFGKYGEPGALWGGRIGADGTLVAGKDCTHELVAALESLNPDALPWKATRSPRGPKREYATMSDGTVIEIRDDNYPDEAPDRRPWDS